MTAWPTTGETLVLASPPQEARNGAGRTEWLESPSEAEGLSRHLETIRDRLWVIVAIVLASLVGAISYVATADRVYEAQTDLLVNPIPANDPSLIGLGLIRGTADPSRDIETAARLVTTTEVADRARRDLGLGRSSEALLADVRATPVAQSNVVTVAARSDTPALARDLANGMADAVIAHRTELLHEQLDAVLPDLRQRLRGLRDRDPGAAEGIAAQVAQLSTMREGADPTLRVEARATAPSSPVAPRPALSIAAGLTGGLILGLVAAFALQLIDPRLRREEQLRRLYRLPVLTRVPRDKQRRGRSTDAPLAPGQMSPRTAAAYRTLQATLAASRANPDAARSILVTSPGASEGKTSTAINLAASLALSGKKVILIEADLRRPSISKGLGVETRTGVVKVLIGRATLSEALVSTKTFGPNLQLLIADYSGGWMGELLSMPAGKRLVDSAMELADYVIIDSPPLAEVTDALQLVDYVNEVVLVARIGRTHLAKAAQLGELLDQHHVVPAGVVLVGTSGGPTPYYYEPYGDTEASDGPRSRWTLSRFALPWRDG